MLKKTILIILTLVILAAGFIGWRFFTSNTAFDQSHRYLYIRTGHATYPEVLTTIKDSQYLKNPGAFDFLAQRFDLPEKIRPGRYEIKKGMSISAVVRMLRNGSQQPVKLVITKLRTRQDLASLIGRKFECDSSSVMAFITNTDSVSHYGFDTNSIMTTVYPNTYTYFWNTTPSAIFQKLFAEYKKVWTPERKQQALQQQLTQAQAYTVASIIEEETNANEEKGNMASVYLNRYRKGMMLQADPTVKFALQDFSIKRIYDKHTAVQSPYNTYRVTGLPPGPICTPSLLTLDAVLTAPSTNYLFFVVQAGTNGRHTFSETYQEHLLKAKAYQKALDSLLSVKKAATEDIDIK